MPAEIELFSGPGCIRCEGAKTLLTEHGIAFVERSVAEPDHLEEFRRRLPRVTSIPQIFVDGEHIGTDDDLRLRLDGGRSPFG